MKTPNLGKRRSIGGIFDTQTKRVTKSDLRKRIIRTTHQEPDKPVRINDFILKPGHKGHFTKGKRVYFCEVLALKEIKTGYWSVTTSGISVSKGPRFWQFTYTVKILEN